MNDLELLRALRDSDARDPSPEVRATARRALLEEAARARAPRKRRWLLAPAAAAAIAAVAVAIGTGVDSGDVAPPPSSARAALERVARVAQSQTSLDVPPGKFLYIRERDAYLATVADKPSWSTITPETRETWVGRDGSGRFVIRGRAVVFPGPRDHARWVAAGRPEFAAPSNASDAARAESYSNKGFTTGSQSLSYDQLAALPTDGQAMYHRLVELAGDGGSSPDQEAFVIIGDLLRSAPVPRDVRAGLYRAAAYIKGIRFAGEVSDALGRHGLAVDLPSGHGTRNRLVFDPKTSELLAEEEVLTRRVPYVDAAPGFAIGSRVVLQMAVVDSDTAAPARR
jgi:hypothetical protein